MSTTDLLHDLGSAGSTAHHDSEAESASTTPPPETAAPLAESGMLATPLSGTPASSAVYRASAPATTRPSASPQIAPPSSQVTSMLPAITFNPSVTAQYPAFGSVPPPPNHPRFAYESPERSARPAPLRLKMSVVVLAVVAAASVGGAVIVRDHPHWRLGGVAITQNRAAVAPKPVPSFRLVSTSSTESIYSVPASTFAVTVSAAHPCWVLMKSVPGGKTLLSETLLPSVPPVPVTSNGDASVSVAARAQSIVLSAGGKTIGTIATPVVGHTYLLDATR